ncbi:hypothetical protein [Lactobacillus delbrueckii]|uniref:hypothetical protein n=1 Tax=Lactobacillus delbrueckii TaxID=1584 RepID=UPI0021A58AF0|nr:hypothetical protein [Lactobacillus delbrueckii]MCT2879025.1 hypothetical protein [Lactobacillus delbrueckii]MCT3492254.1 hypothetical protein [Lactobacillus delbrueckii]
MEKKRVWLFILAFSLIGLLVYGVEIVYAFMKDRNKKMGYSFDEEEAEDPQEMEADYKNQE